uniref:CSON009479 protein n=1 Tax=Culicoides sonorensis TaxID=179676 RepID=A0A336M450_CULSO
MACWKDKVLDIDSLLFSTNPAKLMLLLRAETFGLNPSSDDIKNELSAIVDSLIRYPALYCLQYFYETDSMFWDY